MEKIRYLVNSKKNKIFFIFYRKTPFPPIIRPFKIIRSKNFRQLKLMRHELCKLSKIFDNLNNTYTNYASCRKFSTTSNFRVGQKTYGPGQVYRIPCKNNKNVTKF